MNIPFTQHTLENGLRVIIHEDRRLPMVAVNLWYHVGSKNEHPGRTGFAHLFEHLMFEGSQHYDKGYFHPLQEAGAALNGSTNPDRTNYWEVVPTNALDLALWMESDRMGYLLPALTMQKFETQREVVLNERRQNYENRPYGLSTMAIVAALFPSNHPYHWMTIGETADLKAATFDDVREFFRTYYHPSNASLVVAGDVDTDDALDRVKQHFDEIPPGPKPAPLDLTAEITGERRLVLEDRVELPRLYLSWHSPAMFTDGDAEMDLLSDLFANGKVSRLYKALVYERRIASEVMAFQNSRELGGFWQVVATAAPGHTLVELQQAIDEELAQLTDEGPTEDEMQRGHAQVEAQFVYRLQTLGGFGGKADQLNAYSVFVNDPGYFERDLARYAGVTAAGSASRGPKVSPHRQSRGDERRPQRKAVARAAGFDAGGGVVTRADRTRLPAVGPSLPFRFSRIEKDRLPNRLALWSAEHRTLPVVTFMLVLPSGSAADFEGYEGLAAITADMMDEGTGNMSAIDVNAAFARIGAHLETDVSADATVFTVTVARQIRTAGAVALRRLRHPPETRRGRFRSDPAAAAHAARADSRHAVGDRRSRVHAGRLRHASVRAHGARHRGVAAATHDRHGQDVPRAPVPRAERHADCVGRHRGRRVSAGWLRTHSEPGWTGRLRFPTTPRSFRRRLRRFIGSSSSTSRARRKARFGSARWVCRATRRTIIS